MRRVTANDIKAMKAKGEKIPVITAYDYPTARLADEAGFPIILVGDSLGMVVLGYESTIPVTMDDMAHHTKAITLQRHFEALKARLPDLLPVYLALSRASIPLVASRVGDERLREMKNLISEYTPQP